MLYVVSAVLFFAAVFAIAWRWRVRHDFWLTTAEAPMFSPGESIRLSHVASGRVLRVTRYALLVRPDK